MFWFLIIASVVGLMVSSLAANKNPGNVVVVVLPLILLAGWFIGSLVERGAEELGSAGGRRAFVWGELPILAFALVLVSLIYLQAVSFFQSNQFSPGVEFLHKLISPNAAPDALGPAAIVIGILTLILIAFVALLAVGTVGKSRAATLSAVAVALVLTFSGVRSLWLANYSRSATVDELLVGQQTSSQVHDLVADLERESQFHASDPHVISLHVDQDVGPVVRWYLRIFPNQIQDRPQNNQSVQAIVTRADAPAPQGSWISQRYRTEMQWLPQDLGGANLWKWLLFRTGGVESWQQVRLWLPQPQ